MKMIMIKNKYLGLNKSLAIDESEKIRVGEQVVFSDDNGLHLAEVQHLGGKFDPNGTLIFEHRATAQDLEKARATENKVRRAHRYCESMLLKHKLEIKIVDVYATLDFGKLIFYFTASERVDFRELVKDLASELHTRIEMRQINDRDEIAMQGGIGPCGQLCCCKRFLADAGQVGIKMAKNQGLALSPNKINGYCGKLMCCLGYENDVYLDAMAEMPKVGSTINLPTGEQGIVRFNKLLEKIVSVENVGDEAVMIDYSLDELKLCNEKFETIICKHACACEDLESSKFACENTQMEQFERKESAYGDKIKYNNENTKNEKNIKILTENNKKTRKNAENTQKNTTKAQKNSGNPQKNDVKILKNNNIVQKNDNSTKKDFDKAQKLQQNASTSQDMYTQNGQKTQADIKNKNQKNAEKTPKSDKNVQKNVEKIKNNRQKQKSNNLKAGESKSFVNNKAQKGEQKSSATHSGAGAVNRSSSRGRSNLRDGGGGNEQG